MNIAFLRAGRILVPALLCLAPTMTLAAASRSFTLLRSVPETLTPAALSAAEKVQTPGAVSPDGKTLTFTQPNVRLMAETGPEKDMLSYRIGGLRNPTFVVPKGAVLTVLFVNTDDDMAHNIRFGPAPAAYPNMMAAFEKSSVGTPELAHKPEAVLHAEELTFRAPAAPGAYAYFCTVRGHAQGGMTGKIVVRQEAKKGTR